MPETTVSNMPTAAIWIIAAAQIIFAIATLLIAVVAISLLGAIKKLIDELTQVTKEAKQNMPRLMNSWERR